MSQMLPKIMKAATKGYEAVMGETPFWMGVPTKLIQKKTLVIAAPDRLPVHTLTFEIPKDGKFSGPAKPHSQVRLDLGEVVKMVIPNYKPKSYSMSAIREDEFDITIKVYPNGRASGFLDRLEIGDTIGTFGMGKKKRNPGSFVGIVAYGVGITEAFPVARAECEKPDASKVVLLWASRTLADTFWKEEIAALQQEYPEKFELRMIFSREEVDGSLHGRISPEVLRDVFHAAKASSDPRFLSVGTKEMMSMTDQMLGKVGFGMPTHSLLMKG